MRKSAERLLEAILEAVEAARAMLPSEDVEVKGFAIDAIRELSERAMMLMSYLMRKSSKKPERNPLARRVRIVGEKQ